MLSVFSKYEYTDAPVTIPVRSGDLTPFTDFTTVPVTNIQVTPNVSWNGVTNITKLQVTWDSTSITGRSDSYNLVWHNDSGIVTEITDLTTPSYDILNPVAGNYTILVTSVHGITKIATTPVKIVYEYKLNGLSSLLPPINPYVVGSNTLIVTSEVIKLAWEYNTANDTVEDKLVSYLVEVYDEIPAVLINSYEVKALDNKNGNLSLPYSEIFSIFGTYPRKITFKVFSKDTFGDKSTDNLQFTVENPVPAATTFTLTAIEKAIQVQIATPTDTDGIGYNVYTSLTSGGSRTLVYSGKERFITIPQTEVPPVLKYVTIDAYDLLGATGLITSPEQSVIAIAPINLTRNFIASGETVTIPEGYQLIVAEELTNDGELINNNMVFII